MATDASVVVASFSGEAALRRCLESLEPQATAAEVVVATDVDAGPLGRLQERFPLFRFLPAPAGTSVFRLRSMGVDQASRPLILMTEDHCTFAPGWLDALVSGLRSGRPIVGGPVEIGEAVRAYEWALYLCEYAAHMPPVAEGPVPALSGVNVAYRRDVLSSCRGVWQDAFYENEVHDALRATGHGLFRSGGAILTSHLSLPLGPAAGHLFRGGRRFGGHRRRHASPAMRVALPIGALALPALLTWRVLRVAAARRPERLGMTVRALPSIVTLNSAWSAGEARGYLA